MSTWPSSISNQLIQKASSSSLGTTIASLAPAQPEYGLTSVIRDLSKELEASLELTYNLSSSLGIGVPPQNGDPETLGHFNALCAALSRVRLVNERLSQAIQHLNS